MNQVTDKTWQDLCQAAATEQDPKKLMMLVAQIIKKLDDRDRKDSAPAVNNNNKDCEGSSSPNVYDVDCKGQTCESGLSV